MLDLDFRLQNFSLGLAFDKKYGCSHILYKIDFEFADQICCIFGTSQLKNLK
jgi:hypothetical protein